MIEKDLSFDGFDPKTVYQMIPEGQTRTGFRVRTGAEPVEVTLEPPIVRFSSPRSFVPPTNTPIEDFFMKLGPRTVASFNLFGISEGQAHLVVRTAAGKVLDSMIISVKKPLEKSYSLCLLHDMHHRSPWLPLNDPTKPNPPAADAIVRPMMEIVKFVFERQANVILREKSAQIFDANVNDRDLGDPLFLDKVHKPDNKRASSIIIEKTDPAAFGASFVIVFTWDIRDRGGDIVGLTIARQFCFVEFNSTNAKENALTTAHELGHALGLEHNGHDVLMAGDGISRSSILNQFEIDTINRSGTIPLPEPSELVGRVR